jgi:hypothetical protein
MSQPSGAERMFTSLVSFLQAPTWDGSKRILESHPELMGDAGRRMLGLLMSDRETVAWIYPGLDPGQSDILIQLHHLVLGRCRQIGPWAAFAELDAQIGPLKSVAGEKAPLALGAFLTAESADETLAVLGRYPGLAEATTAVLLDRLIVAARERGDLASRRRLAERRRLLDRPAAGGLRETPGRPSSSWLIATLTVIGVAVVGSALAMILMAGWSSSRSGSGAVASDVAPTAKKTSRTSPSQAQPSATGETQRTARPTPPPSQTRAVAATHQASPQSTSQPTDVEPTTPGSETASPTDPPDPSPPRINDVRTYQEGTLVFFSIRFSDPDGDAEGFGFRGANGSTWPEETHPFSSPALGRVGPGRIDYPFDLGCGTYDEFESDVEAWIYDCTGRQSRSVVIHLACAPYGA